MISTSEIAINAAGRRKLQNIIKELYEISENLDNTVIVAELFSYHLSVKLKTKEKRRVLSEVRIPANEEDLDASNIFIELLNKMDKKDHYLENFNRKILKCERCKKNEFNGSFR